MPVEKIVTDSNGALNQDTFFDHANETVTVTQTQDDAPIRDYIRDKRLAGAKYVDGMGYEIATLPEALCVAYGTARGLPNGWYLKAGFDDEMRKLIAGHSVFNPHGKRM